MKKFLKAFIAIMLVATCLPLTKISATTNVAAIGTTEFTTLQEAVDATTSGQTVVMLADCELTQAVEIASDKNLTIDLNGHTISYNPTASTNTYAIGNSGTLTVVDNSLEKTGKITNNAKNPDEAAIPGFASNTIINNGSFTLESGSIENTTASGSACYAIDTKWYGDSHDVNPTITINGGKVSAVKPAIRLIGYSDQVDNNLIVNGGEISGTYAVWVHLPSASSEKAPLVNIDVNGGTLTSTDDYYYMAIYNYSFGNSHDGIEINITDGTINGYVALEGGSKVGTATVNVSGGTLTSVYSYTYNLDEPSNTITVSGGTFEEELESYVNFADGYEMVADGTSFKVVCTHPTTKLTDITEVLPTTEKTGVKAHQKCACGALLLNGEEVNEADLIIDKLKPTEKPVENPAEKPVGPGTGDPTSVGSLVAMLVGSLGVLLRKRK